jgi:hypothetical protein
MPYAWTTHDDYQPHDAIIVGIGGTDSTMIAAGLSYVEPQADISWFGNVTSQGVFDDGGELGYSVPEALERAEVLREQMGYSRVFISIQECGMWREAWGRLAEQEER